MKAEVCEKCDTYLKILFMDRDPQVDPVADDLATLPLDLLVADTGRMPSGVNFMPLGAHISGDFIEFMPRP